MAERQSTGIKSSLIFALILQQTSVSSACPLRSVRKQSLRHREEQKDSMEKKIILRGIRITHFLLSGQSSYPVRLEGHLNLNLALECIIIEVNTEVLLTMLVKILTEERSNFSPLFFDTPFNKGERTDFCTSWASSNFPPQFFLIKKIWRNF